MSKMNKPQNPQKKSKGAQWLLVGILGILVLGMAGLLLDSPSSEELDLSVIGKGENVVVQVHDPY